MWHSVSMTVSLPHKSLNCCLLVLISVSDWTLTDTTQWLVESPKGWKRISVWPWRGRCHDVERIYWACFTVSASTRKSSSSSLFRDTWFVTVEPVSSSYSRQFQHSWTDINELSIILSLDKEWILSVVYSDCALLLFLLMLRELNHTGFVVLRYVDNQGKKTTFFSYVLLKVVSLA